MIAEERPQRFVGLDIHKHYLIAIGVDPDGEEVLGPQRVEWAHFERWIEKTLTPEDAAVVEMTTNTWEVHDRLVDRVHSVTVVHPPHVAMITRAQVMNDKKAARILARLHAAGLLPGIWVPPQEIRDLRALVAQRSRMVRLSVQARNRLHAVLHRSHFSPPEGSPFAPELREWWLSLPVSVVEQARIRVDLDTLEFARRQVDYLRDALTKLGTQDDRLPLLVQLPGIGLITAMTLIAAIGDIERFPSAKHLVGYAGLGGRVHDSGLTRRSGRITKAGRRELRATLIEAAHTAANTHPFWKEELKRLEPRLGRNKTIVAFARRLLVAVWHILTKQQADRYSTPERIARALLSYTNNMGKNSRPEGQTATQFVRLQLDRMGIGRDIQTIPRNRNKTVPLPPSALPPVAAA
jgi:transposase